MVSYENKEYVFDEQIPTINDDSTEEEIEAHQKHCDDANKVSCIMASSMSPELQKTFENTWAYEMNQQLKEMFQAKASKERLDVVKPLMACKPKPEAFICAFVLEMKGYFDKLESLNLGKAAQGKSDRRSKRKAEAEIAPTNDQKEAVCFYCNTKGNWKRSCPKYLKDLKDEKDLKESRRLKHRELNLVMGNRKITLVTRIGKYELMLKSGMCVDHSDMPQKMENATTLRLLMILVDMDMFIRLNISRIPLKYSKEEFQEPEFEGYGPKTSKSDSEDISNEVRKSNDSPLFEKLVSDDKSEKKIVFPTVAKIEVVKSKQQEKPVKTSIEKQSLLSSTNGFHIEDDKIIDKYTNELDKPANARCLLYFKHDESTSTESWRRSLDNYKDDSRSQSGWVFLINGGAVTWKSSKQDTVADSTCESEYIAAFEASKEAIWMKNFIGDLGVVPTVQDPIEIFCDNKSAVTLTKEPKDHRKSKHIDRKYHFVRSKVKEGHVIMKEVRSEDNLADPFIKALAKSRHDEHARSIGLKDKINGAGVGRMAGFYSYTLGVHTLMTEAGLVIHMLVKKKYHLRKKVLLQMLELKLESEEDNTMALELIRFVKKLVVELEPEVSNGDEEDL
ncbi:retrotransposon protein, putative, ty1-copia subclass [Tanacetum coccineum]|uniref:Retrotransposon protein, putative, ty1-copia subclass n=1 Tax=Tanacetum coccineum TaxID=301880 RepID=A0ABQ4WXG1_9ASTR